MLNLYYKTPEEIKNEENLHRSYKDFEFKACPMYVTDKSGTKIDVWDLSEKTIYGLLGDLVNFFQANGNNATYKNDMKKFELISDCWMQKNSASDKLVYNIINSTSKMDKGPSREVARDLSGKIINKRYEEVRTAYNLVNGTWPNMEQVAGMLEKSIKSKEENNVNDKDDSSPDM